MIGLAPAAGRRCRAEGAVCRALAALGAREDELLAHSIRNWASITFAGTRHALTYAFDGEEAVARGEAMMDALEEHDWGIPGRVVADAAVTRVDHRLGPPRLVVDLEVLLLEHA